MMLAADLHVGAGPAVAGRPLADGAARRGLGAGRVAVVVCRLRVLLRRRRGYRRRRLRAQEGRHHCVRRLGGGRKWGVLRSEGGHLLLALVRLLPLLRAVETAVPRKRVELSLVAAAALCSAAPVGPVVDCVEDHAALDERGPGTAGAGVRFRTHSEAPFVGTSFVELVLLDELVCRGLRHFSLTAFTRKSEIASYEDMKNE